jgi:hypothetical protein
LRFLEVTCFHNCSPNVSDSPSFCKQLPDLTQTSDLARHFRSQFGSRSEDLSRMPIGTGFYLGNRKLRSKDDSMPKNSGVTNTTKDRRSEGAGRAFFSNAWTYPGNPAAQWAMRPALDAVVA